LPSEKQQQTTTMVLVYFTTKEMIRNWYLAAKEYGNFHVDRCDRAITGVLISNSPDCPQYPTEYAKFEQIERLYADEFVKTIDKFRGDELPSEFHIVSADRQAKYRVLKMDRQVILSVQEYNVMTVLLDIYSKAFMEALRKSGEGSMVLHFECPYSTKHPPLEINRKLGLKDVRDSVQWLNQDPTCKIDDVVYNGKIGETFDVDELGKQETWQCAIDGCVYEGKLGNSVEEPIEEDIQQEKWQCAIDGCVFEGTLGKSVEEPVDEDIQQATWQEKKQRAFHWFQIIVLAFCLILVVGDLYDLVGAKVVETVESFDYQAMLPSIDFSFLETGPSSTTTTTTTIPFTFAEHVSLVQGQVTPAHLDEARGLELYDLVQELLSDKSTQGGEVGESCCQHDHVACRAKALLLHSIPEGLASYWTTVEDVVEQQEEEAPIDFVGFVLEHEFLFHESIDDDDKDSTPTSDVYQRWFKWIFDWLSGRPMDNPTPSETNTTTPVESPIPTIFPLNPEGYGPQENASSASDVCPLDDSIVDIVVQALHQVDKYMDVHVSSGWCQTAASINAAWAIPFCFMY
jgi:hypothetical protein